MGLPELSTTELENVKSGKKSHRSVSKGEAWKRSKQNTHLPNFFQRP
jgi:hypothetical protein